MPEEQEQFKKSVEEALEAVMFENWVRFYFLQESGEKGADGGPSLNIVIPEKGMGKIKELYPHMVSMAEYLNGREASFETSRSAICDYVFVQMEGRSIPKGTGASLIDTKAFQLEMQLFNIWVQAYESKLDEQFLEFGQWRLIFEEWRKSEQGKDIAAKIVMAAPSSQKVVQ